MANFVSPGNYVIVQSNDGFIASLNSKAVGIVAFASRGPIGVPTLVTNQESLIKTFGAPDRASGGQGIIGAYELLESTNSVWVQRVAAPSKSKAVANIEIGAQPHVAVSALDNSRGYAFLIDVVKQDGTSANSSPYIVGVPSGTDTISDLSDTVASYLPQEADFDFVKISSSLGYFVGNYAGETATLSVTGIATDGNGGIFSSLGATGRAAGGGGSPLEGDNGILSTPSEAALLAQANAWTANTTHALFGTPGVHYTDVLSINDWVSGLNTYAAYQGSSVTSEGNRLVSSVASGGVVNLESLYEGAGYNYSTSGTVNGLKSYGLRATVSSNRGKDSSISFSMDGAVEESYQVDFINPIDNSTNWIFDNLNIEDANNNPTSRYYTARLGSIEPTGFLATDGTLTAPLLYTSTFVGAGHITGAAPTSGTATMIFAKVIEGVEDFSNGVNGDVADEGGSLTDADIKTALIGSTASKTGIYGFLDNTVDISFLLIPGIHVQDVQDAAISLAQTEERFRYITSPPEGLPSMQRAVNWHNGAGDGRTAAVNHYLTSVQWPWTEFFDVFAGAKDNLDPGVSKAKLLVQLTDPWQAAAGMKRGRLTKASDVEVVVSQGDRDYGYGGGNAINPIAKFPQEGIVMFGQRTSQREDNSLNRENVADLLLVIKKQILRSTRDFAFEPNDPITWSRIVGRLTPFLADIKERRGIVGFTVICDKTTNTQARVDRGEIWCKVNVEPVKIGEIVVFELNVTNQTGGISIN